MRLSYATLYELGDLRDPQAEWALQEHPVFERVYKRPYHFVTRAGEIRLRCEHGSEWSRNPHAPRASNRIR